MSLIPKLVAATLGLLASLAAPGTAQVSRPDVSEELRAVRRVLSDEQMKKAMAFVEREQAKPDDILQEFLGLCNAYGPESDEIYRSRHIYKLLRIYGLENVHIDREMNVIGIRPGVGKGPKVVLTAHHDAVNLWPKDQPIEAFIADGRVWCPAASDDLIGVVQMLTVLRALNAANIQTQGDVWFTTFTGEEKGSRGAHLFAAEHYPHNLDWRKGDIIVQFHGGGGEGVSTGSDPLYNQAELRLFTPFERNDPALPHGVDRRWMPHAVDALAQIMVRVRKEVWDPRVAQIDFRAEGMPADPPVLFMNMAKIEAIPIMNAPASEATVTFDLRSKSEAVLLKAHGDIRRIATEVCANFPKTLACSFQYEIVRRSGLTDGIPGWDRGNNRPARMAIAASTVLYGGNPAIDPAQGCGDCIATYMEGMPSMSWAGRVMDYGKGRVERGSGLQSGVLKSETRRRTTGHNVTQSAEIETIWAAAKQALVFTAAYVGIAPVSGSVAR
jgi:acetylornithine deacetylase/succinyl-diaminopimelate desuccinylase-like protein